MKVLIAGVKDMSAIDLYGHFTTTVWLCGCNLKCPFCHNWKIADSLECKAMDISEAVEEIVQKVRWNEGLVEYVHLTGGEPLLWADFILELEKATVGTAVGVSINSNFTVPFTEKAKEAVRRAQAVATDLKVPPEELYGLKREAMTTAAFSFMLWMDFIRTEAHLDVIEVRVPVFKGWMDAVSRSPIAKDLIRKVKDALTEADALEKRLIVQRLITDPLDPRDRKWCAEKCNMPAGEVEEIAEKFREMFEGTGVEVLVNLND